MKLTKLLFAISDVFCVLGAALLLLGAITFAFIGEAYGRMEHIPIGPLQVALVVLICLVTAGGFVLILRRRPVGLLLALATPVAYLIQGRVLLALIFVLALLMIAGAPFLVALAEARRDAPERSHGA